MQELIFEDFEKIVDEEGMYYYSYHFVSNNIRYEICLECCFSGFDVALYKSANKDIDNILMTKKICTNYDGYLNLSVSFVERDQKTKLRAVSIANEMIKNTLVDNVVKTK